MTANAQIVRYVFVGGIITLVDLLAYSSLAGKFRVPRILANTVSTTVGMLVGFNFHFIFVFQPQFARIPTRFAGYILTVACSVYIIQNVVISFSAGRVRDCVSLIGSMPTFCESIDKLDRLDRLGGKCLAAGAGMIWNFVLFKYFVYA